MRPNKINPLTEEAGKCSGDSVPVAVDSDWGRGLAGKVEKR